MGQDFALSLIDAIDSQDPARFGEFITDDAEFRFGNAPPICGRAAIEEGIGAFFSQIRSIRHRLVRALRCGDVEIAELEVRYVRLDGSELVVPACNLMTMRGSKIADYRIFVDNSQLFAPAASLAEA